jgi:hypothetical protein
MYYRDTFAGLIWRKKNVHCPKVDSKGEGKEAKLPAWRGRGKGQGVQEGEVPVNSEKYEYKPELVRDSLCMYCFRFSYF